MTDTAETHKNVFSQLEKKAPAHGVYYNTLIYEEQGKVAACDHAFCVTCYP